MAGIFRGFNFLLSSGLCFSVGAVSPGLGESVLSIGPERCTNLGDDGHSTAQSALKADVAGSHVRNEWCFVDRIAQERTIAEKSNMGVLPLCVRWSIAGTADGVKCRFVSLLE